jgi:ABC-type oligopeptide transport system ATPase subunit
MASGVLVWGTVHGSGKTIVGHTLMRLYGKYSTEVKDIDLDSGDYSYAEDKQFVLVDDITGQDNRKLKQRLKTMITQQEIRIDIKFVPKYTTPDCINNYFTGNDPDAFYMDDGDRRFFIHEVTSGKMPEALRHVYKVWKNSEEGMQALMHYLMHLDLTGFDPDAEAYATTAKSNMIGITKGDLALWCFELKEDPDRKLKMAGDLFTSRELLAFYDPVGIGKVTINGMARELARAGFRHAGLNGNIAITEYGNVRLFAIKNPQHWAKQPAKKVVEHYEAHRVMVPVGMANRVKHAGRKKTV